MNEIKSKEIKMIDIDSIVANPKNRNIHPESQLKRLEKLIKHNGFRIPLIVSNLSGFLIAGHARLETAKKMGFEKLPVIFQDFKNEAEEHQFLIADNEISKWAELDMDSVLKDIAEFGDDFDNDLLGIEDFNLKKSENDIMDEVPINDSNENIYMIEVKFPNEEEMTKVNDELSKLGYMVKIK